MVNVYMLIYCVSNFIAKLLCLKGDILNNVEVSRKFIIKVEGR